MNDRELLKRAAKAAGLTIHAKHQAARDACGAGDVGLWIIEESTCWNPLADDGDALRLAVKLGLWEPVMFGHRTEIAPDGDIYAATRRAIVRAAAALVESP